MISPIGHNMHHSFGERNACNFAPIFQHLDRLGGTLNEGEPFWWKMDRLARSGQLTGQEAHAAQVPTLAVPHPTVSAAERPCGVSQPRSRARRTPTRSRR